MVLRTPRGFPYVQPADTLTTYPGISQELAEDIDLAVGFGIGFYPTNNVTVPSGATTPLAPFSIYAPANGFTSDASGITVPVAGFYVVGMTIRWPGAAGGTFRSMSILLEGSNRGQVSTPPYAATVAPLTFAGAGGYLDAGHKVQFNATHDVGSNQIIAGGSSAFTRGYVARVGS